MEDGKRKHTCQGGEVGKGQITGGDGVHVRAQVPKHTLFLFRRHCEAAYIDYDNRDLLNHR